ncbi:hypothetical protein ACFPIF_00125 [Brevundimonas faecalis]|uniref:hypothetical protein n=1 Tax=Brevundimonas faecalis TaxID=947378 RepID=UPI003607A7F6
MLPEQAAVMSASGAPRWACFFRVACKSSVVRAWTGVGDFDIAADDIDAEGGRYKGVGLVGDMPAIRQLVGGVAERVEFALNGADERTFSLADDQVEEVRGAQVHVGIIFFDEDWQAVAPPAWLWEGTADVPAVDRDGSGGQVVRRVTLSVGSAFADRTRAAYAFYTPGDQRRRSPDDAFCDRVPSYGIDSSIQWPAS